MTAEQLRQLRQRLGLTQTEMGKRMGLSLRTYQEIEGGERKLGLRHAVGAERVALSVAVEKRDPMLAPASVRREALELARLLTAD